jgi:hypothetical protein
MPSNKAWKINQEFTKRSDIFVHEPEKLGLKEDTPAYKRAVLLETGGYNFWATLGEYYAHALELLENDIRTTADLSTAKLQQITSLYLKYPEINAPDTSHIDAKLMDWFLGEMLFDYQAAPYFVEKAEAPHPPSA